MRASIWRSAALLSASRLCRISSAYTPRAGFSAMADEMDHLTLSNHGEQCRENLPPPPETLELSGHHQDSNSAEGETLKQRGHESAHYAEPGETLEKSDHESAQHAEGETLQKSDHESAEHAERETLAQSEGQSSGSDEPEQNGHASVKVRGSGSPDIGPAGDSKKPDKVRRQEGKGTVKFQLKNSCVLALQRGDITKWRVDGQTDAIVNAANNRMLGGGGVDGAIHGAAGPDLYKACLKLPFVGKNIRCQTGDAVITKGFRLPVSKIIHTVGPVYDDEETSGPLLESSYKRAILLAVKNGINYLAFPAISCGIYGYPYDKAAEIALDTVNENSADLKEVHFVLFEEGSWVQWLSKAHKSFERCEE